MKTRGQLPKAYLRVDPNLDAHDDPEAMLLMTLWANRQPRRGRFKGLVTLRRVLGEERLDAALERGDLVEQPDGSWYLDGWDLWQEGDLEVGERMRRLREKRSSAVTSDGTDTELDVTGPVTIPSPPSEASRRQGVNGHPPSPPGPVASPATTAQRMRDRESAMEHWRARTREFGTNGPDRKDARSIWAALRRGLTVQQVCGSIDGWVREKLVSEGRLGPEAPWPPEAPADRGPPSAQGAAMVAT